MKLIEKTGSKPESANSTNTRQWGLFECPVCLTHIERPLSHGRRNKSCGSNSCRKATFTISDKPINKPDTSVKPSRTSLRFYNAFKTWYNRLDKELITNDIDTIEKALDLFYIEYEAVKLMYPNQYVVLSLLDSSKGIVKDNVYFTLRAKSTGLTIMDNQIKSLMKHTRIGKNKITKEYNNVNKGLELTEEQYESLLSRLIYNKYAHNKETEYLYFIKAGMFIKIGVAKNVDNRLKSISTGCPFKPEIVATKALGKLCYLVERCLHIQYADKCTNGEWFELDEADIKSIIDTPEDELVSNAAKIINTNKEAYVESTRVYNDESKLSKLRIEAEERYLQTCANYEESKRKAREVNKKPVIETVHEYGDARFAHDRTNQIEAITTHGMVGTAIYTAWQTVKKIYGVSKEWTQFEQFMKDIGAEYDTFAEEDIARIYPVNTANPTGPTNYVIKAKKEHIVKSAVARSVLQLKDGEMVAEYSSVTEAAKSVNGIASKISAVCKGNRKSHAGYEWKYLY